MDAHRVLAEYLNDTDLSRLEVGQEEREQERLRDATYNRRTGRQFIGGRGVKSQQQRLLRPSSKKNYKSTLRKFGQFKVRTVGREGPVTDELLDRYNEFLNGDEANLKYMTRVTHVRTLNKYLVGPLLNREIPRPRAAANVRRINKPRFPHSVVADAVSHVWNRAKNREDAHKIKLAYYTGLRAKELDALTYRSFVEATSVSRRAAVLRVVNGKNGRERNVPLIEPEGLDYYFDCLLPYIKMKWDTLRGTTEDEEGTPLDTPVFDTLYMTTYRTFKRSLRHVLEQASPRIPHLAEAIRGSGLHSVRSDFATRMLRFITQKLGGDTIQAKNALSEIMGSSGRVLYRHYINQGGGGATAALLLQPTSTTALPPPPSDNNDGTAAAPPEWGENGDWGRNIRTVMDRPFMGNNTNMMHLIDDDTTTTTARPTLFYI